MWPLCYVNLDLSLHCLREVRVHGGSSNSLDYAGLPVLSFLVLLGYVLVASTSSSWWLSCRRFILNLSAETVQNCTLNRFFAFADVLSLWSCLIG